MADGKEYWTSGGEQDSVRISEDVIASIAAIAASETEGVGNLRHWHQRRRVFGQEELGEGRKGCVPW